MKSKIIPPWEIVTFIAVPIFILLICVNFIFPLHRNNPEDHEVKDRWGSHVQWKEKHYNEYSHKPVGGTIEWGKYGYQESWAAIEEIDFCKKADLMPFTVDQTFGIQYLETEGGTHEPVSTVIETFVCDEEK